MKKDIHNRNTQLIQPTRHIALLLCVCLIAISLLTTTFLLTHANHDHDQKGPNGSCATCMHVVAAGDLLKTISIAVVAAVFCVAAHHTIISALKPIFSSLHLLTLVSLKVRLNN